MQTLDLRQVQVEPAAPERVQHSQVERPLCSWPLAPCCSQSNQSNTTNVLSPKCARDSSQERTLQDCASQNRSQLTASGAGKHAILLSPFSWIPLLLLLLLPLGNLLTYSKGKHKLVCELSGVPISNHSSSRARSASKYDDSRNDNTRNIQLTATQQCA